MVYKWKFNMGCPAETAGKELERIESKHGKVSAQLVLAESKSKKAPLHGCFEWNNDIAAEKYRLSQAGDIIRNLVVILDEYQQSEPVRAFVNVVSEAPTKTGDFINIVTAMKDKNSRAVVLENALRELKEFQKKYKDLNELSGVFLEISKLKG